MKEIKTSAIVGMGALGMMYGRVIQDHVGKDNFFFAMDKARFKKYNDKENILNGEPYMFSKRSEGNLIPVDLVIVSVKYPSLDEALDIIRPLIKEDTIIMSVMNGISSEEILADNFGKDHLIYTIGQGMDSMNIAGELKYTKMGHIHIGVPADASDIQKGNLRAVASFFEKIEMPYVLEDDIMYRMWAKFMLNVGINQTCMVFGAGYGSVIEDDSIEKAIFVGAMREVILVAEKEGIHLSEDDINSYIDLMATLAPDNTPSMAQDRINKKPSEVEAFAGTVRKLAAKHGINVPANDYLYKRVYEIEKEYL